MISYFIFFDEKTRYIFLQRPFIGRLPAAAPVFTYRLGKMRADGTFSSTAVFEFSFCTSLTERY
jgi:hypothetical protein